MPDMNVGTLKVGVSPDFTGFSEKLKAGLGQNMQAAMSNFSAAQGRMGAATASGSSMAAAHIRNAEAQTRFSSSGGGNGSYVNGGAGANGFAQGMIQAMQTAANALTRAAQAIVGAATGGAANAAGAMPAGSIAAGAGPSSGRFLGIRTAGLSRYVAAGFIAREGLNIAETYRDYNIGSELAGNRPGAQLNNELKLYDRVAGIPIAGQAAGLLIDPSGQKRMAIDATMRSAELGEELAERRLQLSNDVRNATGEEKVSGLRGVRRRLAEVEIDSDREAREIEQKKRDKFTEEKIEEKEKADRARIEARYHYLETWKGTNLEKGKEFAIQSKNRDDDLRNDEDVNSTIRRTMASPFDKMLDESKKKFDNLRAQILQNFTDERKGWVTDTERYQELSKLAPDRNALMKIDERVFNRNALDLRKALPEDQVNQAMLEYTDREHARVTKEKMDFKKSSDRAYYGMRADIETLGIRTSDRLSPATASRIASARSVLRETQLDAYDAWTNMHPELVPTIYHRGELRERELQHDFLNGLRPTEVDPSRVDLSSPGGTEDAATVNREISNDIKTLTKVPQQLAAIISALSGIGTAG